MASQKNSDIETINLHFPASGQPPEKLGSERARVLRDLSKRSRFQLLNDNNAPYCIDLKIEENKLIFKIKNAAQTELPMLILSLTPYKRIIKDYFMMIDSYEALRNETTASKLETIDMARRGLHNEAAEMMMDRLKDKITMDMDTARGLFTLICVLHLGSTKSGWM